MSRLLTPSLICRPLLWRMQLKAERLVQMMAFEDEAIIKKQAKESDELLAAVQDKLTIVMKGAVETCKTNLRKQNENLRKEVSDLKNLLDKYEASNGQECSVPQSTVDEDTSLKMAKANEGKSHKLPKAKPIKEEKQKPVKPSKADPKDELPIDVGRLDFRIGHILSVEKHPDADSLYVEKINVGESQPRTVVSGLVKHMPPEELADRMVVLLCNLKAAKMRGVTSEAMVMCASTPEKVEVLIPPPGCVPGDLVEFEGYPRKPDPVLNPKKKIFETCAPDLKTDDECTATYKQVPFVVPGKGKVRSKNLIGVQIR